MAKRTPNQGKTSITPAMRQYLEIKEELGDAIVFFRMGDFYEMFFEDAVLASKVLGITLTSRDRAKEIPMCGFPYHASTGYIKKLILEGYKVAVCEQVEEAGDGSAGKKGLVRREVAKVITPGTVLDDELLEPENNNFIASINASHGLYGLSYMDLSTGEFFVTELGGPDELIDELMALRPLEALVGEEWTGLATGPGLSIKKVSTRAERDFSLSLNVKRLTEHFHTAGLHGFGCGGLKAGVGAAGALLTYIKETQRSDLPHIRKLTPYITDDYMALDSSTRRNLELTENNRTGTRTGTLLEILDETATAMGARLLQSWMGRPLKNSLEIKGRQNAVDELFTKKTLRDALGGLLKGVADLQRLSARVSMGSASPRDLVSLKESLKKAGAIKKTLTDLNSSLLNDIHTSLDPVEEASSLIDETIVERPPLAVKDGGVIRLGFNAELDGYRETGAGGKDWIAALEREERQKTGINTLKVGYNRVFGYYIEVTRANLGNVPAGYTRKQTLVNAERFITEDLKVWEERILRAEDEALVLEAAIYTRLIETLRPMEARIRRTAELVACLDVLTSFSLLAIKHNYTKPAIDDERAIEITGGRHPVVEAAVGGEFIDNDLCLDSAGEAVIILTGPNMAGKSTYLRQNALIVYMAQLGSFVPAKEARIGVVDRIFTRVGASDDLRSNQSTFMVEMNETANILNNATSKSLIILDEIGRGTSTFDGLSIAWAVVEYLHDHLKEPPKTLFATHYHELTELSLTLERLKNYNMAVKEWEGEIIFLRKVQPGEASSSYGIHVARLAGLPDEVIVRSREILRNLESGELTEKGLPRLAKGRAGEQRGGGGRDKTSPLQGNLLGSEDRLRKEIRSIDLDNTTPIEALKTLQKLKDTIKDS
ncbi:MAG: DNA mismatch repair protein MutS [Thermodesulfobacteriota bacterium]